MIYCLCCPVNLSKKPKLSTLFDEKQQINNRIENSVKNVPIMAGRKRGDSVTLIQPELVIEASKVEAPEASGGSAAPAGPAPAMAAIAPVVVAQEEASSESDMSSSASSLTTNESSSETDLTYGTYDSSSDSFSTESFY